MAWNYIMDTEQSRSTTLSQPVFLGMGMVMLAALGFASKGILIKLAYALDQEIDAISLMAIRMLIALPFFLVVALHSSRSDKHTRMTWLDVLAILALGFLGYYLSSLLDFSGLAYISASLERMILYLYPTLVVILAALISRRRIRPYEQAALLIAYLGMLLMFITDRSGINADIIKGGGLVFAAALSFAIFMVASHGVINRVGSLRFTSWSMTVATLFTLTHYTVQHGMQLFNMTSAFYLIGLTMAIFCTVLPAYMMNAGIQRIGASRTALVSAVGPVMTLILAYFVLGETLTLLQLAGITLIIGSIYIVGKGK
jgi:drug/metabolite transporter (DMT)-like permease